MSAFWKVIVGLLVVLPVAAYVTGTLVTSQAEMPSERPPIVITDSPSDRPGASPTPGRGKSTSPKPTKRPAGGDDDAGARGGDDGRRGGEDDDAQVIRPTPNDVDDDGDDDGGDDSDDGEGDDDD